MADELKPRGCMPSNGALMLLGAGLAVPAWLLANAGKPDSGISEMTFVIAGIVFLAGLVRMIVQATRRKR